MVEGRKHQPRAKGWEDGKLSLVVSTWKEIQQGKKKCFQTVKGSQLPGKLKLLLDESDLLSFPLQSLPGCESRKSQP